MISISNRLRLPVLAVALFAASACSDSGDPTNPSGETAITGKWSLVQVLGESLPYTYLVEYSPDCDDQAISAGHEYGQEEQEIHAMTLEFKANGDYAGAASGRTRCVFFDSDDNAAVTTPWVDESMAANVGGAWKHVTGSQYRMWSLGSNPELDDPDLVVTIQDNRLTVGLPAAPGIAYMVFQRD